MAGRAEESALDHRRNLHFHEKLPYNISYYCNRFWKTFSDFPLWRNADAPPPGGRDLPEGVWANWTRPFPARREGDRYASDMDG